MRKPMVTLCILLMVGLAGFAGTPEDKGLEIAREADLRDQGFGDYQSEIVMTLKNRKGQTSTRNIRSRVLEVKDDGDKLLVIFDDPRDVKGTAFLTHTHRSGPDDQWLYLPALKRVKRISSSNKSGPFMGSEFAYEDLASQEVEKYTYKFLREEELDGMSCFVIERDPTDPKSGYTRQVVWLDKQEYRYLRIDYYDRKNALLKTQTFHGYQQFLEKFWRPARALMVNHLTKKETTLEWKNYAFQNNFTDRDFDQTSLKRAR